MWSSIFHIKRKVESDLNSSKELEKKLATQEK